jgi:sugar phosphate isomerase/epimerase
LGVNEPSFPGPHLACSTGAFFGRPLKEAFEHIAAAGYTGVEIMVTHDPASQDPRMLRELSEGHGLAIRAVHAPFLLMTRRVWGTDPIAKIYRSIELAEEIDAPLVVVHPPYRWQAKYRRWLDEQLPELSDHTGVMVGMENMFPVRLRGERGVTFHVRQQLEDLERFPHVVLDTSHAAVAGVDPLDAFRRLGDRLVHIHLSNNAGRGWDSHLPVDRGVLPIGQFLDVLAAEGFTRTISLELDLRQYLDDGSALHEVLVGNRQFCEVRLSPSPGRAVASG